MSALSRRHPVRLILAAALLCLAAPAWPATAQGDVRPPGVPPPVDMAALPTATEADTFPYTVHNPVTEQTAPVQQVAPCAHQPPGTALQVDAEPLAQRRLRIREAQQFATGRGQRIAVIDSGVYPHPRLLGRLSDGGDYIENRSGLFDCDGHGTAVAGIIAAARDPATGFVGVAPSAQIVSIRQGSTFYSVPTRQLATGQETGSNSAGDTTSMARAVNRAVRLGATVINISEAACFPATPNQVNAPDLQAAVHDARMRNVVVVVAAANKGDCEQNPPGVVRTISSPGWFDDDVLTVAATDENDNAADFSIRGPWVDVAAPGTGAVSLASSGSALTTVLVDTNGQQRTIDGTSFAAPYVAGLAALVRERFPRLDATQVMRRIEQTAQNAGGPGGRSEDLGYGMVDPVAALTAVLPDEQPARVAIGRPDRLRDFHLPPPDDPLPKTIALAGSAAAIGLLGLTLLVVYTINWYRRHNTQ